MNYIKNGLPILSRVIKWHFNHYILRKDSPLIAAFQLTNLCNFKCRMCNIWQNPKKSTISLSLFKKYIDDLSKMGCCYVTLSGGEPLVIKDIEEYISYAKKKIPFVNLTTNGYLLNDRMAFKLGKLKLDSLSISIDSIADKQDKIRGAIGSYNTCIRAINNLKKYAPKTQIIINTVISPWNIDNLPKLVDLVEKMGIYHKFQPINRHPIYDNQKIKESKWEVTPEFIDKLNILIKQLKKKKNVLNSKYFLSNIPNYFLNKLSGGLFDRDCNLGSFYCDIRENNEIYPCLNGLFAKGGLSIREGLMEIYKSKEYKKLQGGLRKCRYCQKDFQICHLEPRVIFPLTNFIKYSLLKLK